VDTVNAREPTLEESAARISEMENARVIDRAMIAQLQAEGLIDRAVIAELEAQGLVDRDKITNLELALVASRRIGAAMGVLMAIHKITEDDAFNLLRTASHRRGMKLRALAEDVLRTGTLE
jgi:AmiR/NasT family two-component response regulator